MDLCSITYPMDNIKLPGSQKYLLGYKKARIGEKRLDIGEGKEVNLTDKCLRSKLQQQCIKYLDPVGFLQ
ncbi:hypothetical protein Droror1_Dr00000145 [Drosera rotundifolia]